MAENYLWNHLINPSPTYGDDGYEDHEPEPIKIGEWEARYTSMINGRGIYQSYWIITAPSGNTVLEICDVEQWSDLESLANFILAATTEARQVEESTS